MRLNIVWGVKPVRIPRLQASLSTLGGRATKIIDSSRGMHAIQVVFIGDIEMRKLNREYRGKDKTTDVLSWSFVSDDLKGNELAGEIYISIDVAKKQSRQKKHTLLDEVLFLITHGILHIYGYDHENDVQENEMNELAKEILSNMVANLAN